MFSVDVEYERDIRLRRQDVNSLMIWVRTQPHLPQISEQEAILFLKSCYYNNELAKTTLDSYYSFRTNEREIFHARTDDSLRRTSRVGMCTQMSKKTPDGDNILILHLTDPKAENFDHVDNFKLADSVLSLELYEHGPYDGLQVICDLKNFSMSHLPRINLLVAKKALMYVQESLPVRLKGIHCIHVNKTFLDILLSMLKPFMNKDLINMIHIHNDREDLKNFIPLDILPKDYGGLEPSLDDLQEKMTKTLLENRKFFEFQDEQLVDESKRPRESKLSTEVFGVSGTFKRLELD